MQARSSVGWLIAAAPIAFLVGSGGGYLLHEYLSKDQAARPDQEIERLRGAADHVNIDRPSNEEATNAIARSGGAFDITGCEPRQAVPGGYLHQNRHHNIRIIRRNEAA